MVFGNGSISIASAPTAGSSTHEHRHRRTQGVEWPTVFLTVAIYGGWLLLTANAHHLPPLLTVATGAWLIAWHGSLQHEVIHGHPSRWPLLNTLIGAVPLSLWLPFVIYRRSHIAHHATPEITDPVWDTESRYLKQDRSVFGRIRHLVELAQATLAGRLLIGTAIMVGRFLLEELVRLRREPTAVLRDWLPHLAVLALIVWWLERCGLDFTTYALLIVYPGLSLTLLRSFAEHRAASMPDHRVATVERAGPFALLFLHNNLHAAHHRRPGLAWYRLPAYYRSRREQFAQENGGLVYQGYGEIARRYLLRAHDTLVHPNHGTGVERA